MEDQSIYSETRSRKKSGGSGGYVVNTLLFVAVLLLGGCIAWVFFQNQQIQLQLEQRLLTIEQNNALIQEALKITDESFSDIENERQKKLGALEEKIANSDKEILKLWNLGNGRNKKWLETLEEELGTASKKIKSLENSFATDREKVAELVQGINESISALDEKIQKMIEVQQLLADKVEKLEANEDTELEKRITSLESQRGSNNTRIAKLQEDINRLKSRLLSLENNISLPTRNTR